MSFIFTASDASSAFTFGSDHAAITLQFPAAMTGTYSTGCTDIAGTVI